MLLKVNEKTSEIILITLAKNLFLYLEEQSQKSKKFVNPSAIKTGSPDITIINKIK